MNLFRRSWRVQVGELVTEGLAVKFKIKRSLAAVGQCEFTVYGLNEDHRREVTHAPRRTTFVEVQAGYEGGRSTLFRGDLRKAVPAREGTEWSVTVTAGDGEHAIRTARVSRSFAAGATLESVVRAIADAMGVGLGYPVRYIPELFALLTAMFVALAGKNSADNFIAYRERTVSAQYGPVPPNAPTPPQV